MGVKIAFLSFILTISLLIFYVNFPPLFFILFLYFSSFVFLTVVNDRRTRVFYVQSGTKYRPMYHTAGAGAFDLRCTEETIVEPGQVREVSTGLRLQLPKGMAGVIKGRSSLAMKGVLCHSGLIDSDYRGTISVLMYNLTDEPTTLKAGCRVAQLMVVNAYQVELIERASLDTTERGTKGLGSTGDGLLD